MNCKKKCMNLVHLSVYPERFEAFLEDETLEFTPKEFELLSLFIRK